MSQIHSNRTGLRTGSLRFRWRARWLRFIAKPGDDFRPVSGQRPKCQPRLPVVDTTTPVDGEETIVAIETVLNLLSVVVGPIIIGLFFQGFEARRERSREATDLFHRYNSPEMLNARDRAWDFFSSTYAAQPQPWRMFYSDGSLTPGVDRGPLRARHADIVMIASTWALLAVLINERRIDTRLARVLFGIQYRDWGVALRQVRDVTIAAGDSAPEWTMLLPVLDRHLLSTNGDPLPNRLAVPRATAPEAMSAS
jgi:hypothetical protein